MFRSGQIVVVLVGSVFRSGQIVVVVVGTVFKVWLWFFVSLFRSGQIVIVLVGWTSVYPARNRLYVQEWSKCGCGCWQCVQEWSNCGCGCACWQDLSVPGQKPTVCSGVVKMWLWWFTGPQCTRPETDCVFRSGQNVVVVVHRTSVYPARDRLCVQDWSKCGCGGWQDLSVPGQRPTVCLGVVKM